MRALDPRPLVMHLVYRFDTGGLENGVVNLINQMDPARFRHAVVALTEVEPSFAARVRRSDVVFEALHKPAGHAMKVYPRLARLIRSLAPTILHSRNLAALECQLPAALLGVPVRVHGEHGRDSDDPDGTRKKYQLIRRLYRPFVHHYIALSRDLQAYLVDAVGVPPARISQVYNGVDDQRFQPAPDEGWRVADCPFSDPGLCLVGTVGRMQTVKAQPLLARAFAAALAERPDLAGWLRLVMVGEGPLLAECDAVLREAGVRHLAWLPGNRSDVPELMRSLDLFVLPSLAEGISNTILEAMACGLPVIATDVGGNADLVADGRSGEIVAPGEVPALAATIQRWAADEPRRRAAGLEGRQLAVRRFSLQAMVGTYTAIYEHELARAKFAPRRSAREA